MADAKECCGLFGVFGDPDAVQLTHLGIFSLQHRGQESAGIASVRNGRLAFHKSMGLVNEVFTADALENLRSAAAIGHVRYSTTGSSNLANTQPLVVETARQMIAVAHNGNLVNSASLRRALESQKHFFPIFHTSTDTEIILYLAARSPNLIKSLKDALRMVEGAYSLLFLTPKQLIAARDPQGFRPLCIGRKGDAWAVASESCALDIAGFEFVREVAPGEIFVVDKKGPHAERSHPKKACRPAGCAFEHVYFARPDSFLFGDTVHEVRRKLGAALSKEHAVDADIVTPVPDSGMSAALGYARASGIPFEMCFIRNHYVGRTFIQPGEAQRASSVRAKLAVVKQIVAGKRIVVVDDSIIRGTTSKSRMRLLRQAGAKEVHLRISCPPTKFPCYYGIDFPTRSELIAARKTVPQIREHTGVNTLGYLSLRGMLDSMSRPADQYCTACWTGNYTVPPADTMEEKHRLEKRPKTARKR
ncbi:MAG: amidophosphoribosyltransferase [Planctomycetota bacterium]|jgi:amidophosphoribosyltransferase